VTDGTIHPNPIDIKMDGTNYAFWCQAVEMYVKGRERMKHLTGVPQPHGITDPLYQKWLVDDVIIKGWLINSLEPRLRGSYIRYPTARDVWEAIATTFYDGSDEAQNFALNWQVSHLKQGGRAIEEYYDDLQKLWQEIDFRCPNPMECVKDIEAFNTYIRKNRVFVFLDGLDDRLDHVRAEVLKINPFSTIEQAYEHVRRENIRQEVMIKGDGGYQNSMAMVSKGYKSAKVRLTLNKNNSVDKSKLKYSHCGGTRHVKEQCFQIVGYPKWYMERKKISSKCQREKQHLQQPT
jgi:hypothetical protein